MNAFIPTTDMPHNVEAEQQVLGAIMLNNDLYHKVSDILTDQIFYDPVHARVFAICAARIKAAHLVSPVTLKNTLEGDEGLAQLGGNAYLVRMAATSVSQSAIRAYAEAIVDAYQRRVLLNAMSDAKEAIHRGQDVLEAQAMIEAAGQMLAVSDTKKPTTSMLAATVKAMQMVQDAYQGNNSGLLTGIRCLDDLTGGFFPEDMIVIGGAPSMGKTTLALAIAKAIARQDAGVGFVSLEMGDYSLAQRLLSEESDVPYRKLRRGNLDEEDTSKLRRAAQSVANLPIEIVNGHVRDIAGIYASARRVQRSMDGRGQGLRALIIDYLQLIRAPGKDRTQMVAEISMGIKNIAKQMGIPVIALSQVNPRNMAEREDKRPRLSDIRETSQIEMDADLILFTHRDHYHLEREGPPKLKKNESMDARADYEAALTASQFQMDVMLAKHRHDGIGEVKLGCDMATNRIWDLQHGYQASFGM